MPNTNFAPTLANIIRTNIINKCDNLYLQQLLDYFISMNLSKEYFETHTEAYEILSLLVTFGYIELAKQFIHHFAEYPALLHNDHHHKHTAVWYAGICRSEITDIVLSHLLEQEKKYLELNLNQDSEPLGNSLLHILSDDNNALNKLLPRTAELENSARYIDAINLNWETPLHLAIKHKNIKSIIVLICHEARMDIRNKSDITQVQLLLDTLPEKVATIFSGMPEQSRNTFIKEYYRLLRHYYNNPEITKLYYQLLSFHNLKQYIIEKTFITPKWGSKLKKRPDIDNVLYEKYGNVPQIGRSESTVELLPLQFSESFHDFAVKEINRNLAALNRYPTENVSAIIFAYTASFLWLCLNALVPFLFFSKAKEEGFFKVEAENGVGYFICFLLSTIVMTTLSAVGIPTFISLQSNRPFKFSEKDLRIIIAIIDKFLTALPEYNPNHQSIQELTTHKANLHNVTLHEVRETSNKVKNEIDKIKKDCFLHHHCLFKPKEAGSCVIEVRDPPQP